MKKRLLIEDDWTDMQGQVDFCIAELLLRSDLSHSHAWDHITDKPDFHAVSLSGSFEDLDDVPVMFSGDYDDLINKPVLFDGSYNSLDDLPDTFPPSAHGHLIEDTENLQDELDGKIPKSPKADAIRDETAMTVSTTIATGLITLGIQGPLATSIASNINTVKTEVNAVKAKVNDILKALREREIIET